jgi:hypothetical protein
MQLEFSRDFRKVLRHQIAWKCVQWDFSCSMRTDTDTHTDTYTDMHTDTDTDTYTDTHTDKDDETNNRLLHFANTPNKSHQLLLCLHPCFRFVSKYCTGKMEKHLFLTFHQTGHLTPDDNFFYRSVIPLIGWLIFRGTKQTDTYSEFEAYGCYPIIATNKTNECNLHL